MRTLSEPCESSPLDREKMDSDSDKVRMKKELGLLEGVAIILGIIFGSGALQIAVIETFIIIRL